MEGKTQMEIFEKAAGKLYSIVDQIRRVKDWTSFNLLVEEGEATLKVLENSWKVGSGMYDPDHSRDSQNWFDSTFTKKFWTWKDYVEGQLVSRLGRP